MDNKEIQMQTKQRKVNIKKKLRVRLKEMIAYQCAYLSTNPRLEVNLMIEWPSQRSTSC